MASGRPLSPSHTTIKTSVRPRLASSDKTPAQYLEPSPSESPIHTPKMCLWPTRSRPGRWAWTGVRSAGRSSTWPGRGNLGGAPNGPHTKHPLVVQAGLALSNDPRFEAAVRKSTVPTQLGSGPVTGSPTRSRPHRPSHSRMIRQLLPQRLRGGCRSMRASSTSSDTAAASSSVRSPAPTTISNHPLTQTLQCFGEQALETGGDRVITARGVTPRSAPVRGDPPTPPTPTSTTAAVVGDAGAEGFVGLVLGLTRHTRRELRRSTRSRPPAPIKPQFTGWDDHIRRDLPRRAHQNRRRHASARLSGTCAGTTAAARVPSPSRAPPPPSDLLGPARHPGRLSTAPVEADTDATRGPG